MRIRPAAMDLTEQVAALTDEVAQLRDLFTRRLLDDKAKGRLYDALHVQLEQANGALARLSEIATRNILLKRQIARYHNGRLSSA